jgi:hypothetical protein
MAMFGGQDAKGNFERTVKLVETVIQGFGLDPARNRLNTNDGSTAWALMRGSAEVLIFLNPAREQNQQNYMRVVAPCWRLPDQNHQQIYRRLLELNSRDLWGTAFGLMSPQGNPNVVDAVLVTERTTTDLDRGEVEEILNNIGATADHFDDKLVGEFGGTRISDIPRGGGGN